MTYYNEDQYKTKCIEDLCLLAFEADNDIQRHDTEAEAAERKAEDARKRKESIVKTIVAHIVDQQGLTEKTVITENPRQSAECIMFHIRTATPIPFAYQIHPMHKVKRP